jgi:hypothetical protein
VLEEPLLEEDDDEVAAPPLPEEDDEVAGPPLPEEDDEAGPPLLEEDDEVAAPPLPEDELPDVEVVLFCDPLLPQPYAPARTRPKAAVGTSIKERFTCSSGGDQRTGR